MTRAALASTPESAPQSLRPRTLPRPRVAAWVLLVLSGLCALGWPGASAHLRAASLLLRMSGSEGWLARLYDTPIIEENLLLRTEHGPFRARIYRPRDGRPRRGLVLAHGVHYKGIDEPRLRPFARNLARAGLVVMTPELAALADYRIAASSVSELREAARELARRPYVQRGGVGLFGLSFAGGLSLLAAADPSVRGTISYVVSLGGHHDLYRVSRFLATDELETPAGLRRMHAHDYGLIVYFYAHAEHFVAPDQLHLFRDALRQMLRTTREDADRVAVHLRGEARALYDQLRRVDKRALAPLVMRTLPELRAEMRALSPSGHLAGLRGISVFLMHGANDDVMPPTEPEAIARELDGITDVHLLVTPAIHHVTVEGPLTLRERWRILHLMAELLAR